MEYGTNGNLLLELQKIHFLINFISWSGSILCENNLFQFFVKHMQINPRELNKVRERQMRGFQRLRMVKYS